MWMPSQGILTKLGQRCGMLSKGILFPDKARLIRAVKMYSVKECREMMVWESSPDIYKAVCRRWFTDYNWMLRVRKKKSNMWVVGKYIGTHNCEMDTFSGNHFNLDVDLISLILIPYIEASIRYKIKECITSVHQEYGCTITKRKTFLGRKRAFEIVYGDWDKSFASLPKCMVALQHFNPGTVVEWKLEQNVTHVYGKYDIKLLIAVEVDANGQIFLLAFAICANESQETWTLFLNHLKEHVVKQRSDICLISDRHGGILIYECKFRRRMESIRQEDERAYHWLMRHELDRWTFHVDGGRRWGTLTTNMSESFNGLLKYARGLPVTAMQVGAEHYWSPELFKMVRNTEYLRHYRRKCPSASLGVGGNPSPGGSSSNVPNNQGYM
ncbi:uncharacterized protein [Nicotiana tomentosiformis]|uniref:uncharacterized protein n=1 Tax=Nicotiana tomentosiformis TaxID=4098 RepID=UPI00388CC92A